ncbi:MAG: PAS domain S-box protein, partial [Candidatus Competibacteraceae bacterium]|nr:PAS domain S-box protein [Candidatus Competibacteraceae bacterium]
MSGNGNILFSVDRDGALIGAMVHSAADGILVIDERGVVHMLNPAAERLFGYSADEVVGQNISVLMPEPYRSEHDDYLANYLRSGVRRIIGIGREVSGRRRDGSCFPMYLSVGEVSVGDRRMFTGIVQDLTERKQAEEQIARLKRRQELILDAVGNGILGLDSEGLISFANPAACAMLGWECEQLIGTRLSVIWPDTRPDRYPGYHILRENLTCRGDDEWFVRHDGSRFPVEYSGTPIHESEQIVGAVISFQDITERQQTALELQRMRSYLKNVIDSMPSILVGVDGEGRVAEWNQRAEQASGFDQDKLRGRPFTDLFPYLEFQIDHVQEAIRNRLPAQHERVAFEKEGQIRYADVVIYPLVTNGTLGAVIRVDDVTNRVLIEQMMVQTEKMMSVGGLAAGMAHEINNPLSAILQSSQNILRRLTPDMPANRQVAEALGVDLNAMRMYMEQRGIFNFLEGIREAGSRAGRIVADMLAFSRRSDTRFTPVLVPDMLDTVVRLAASDYDLKKNYDFRQIEIVRDYDPKLDKIYCDRTEIEQVLLNLLKNAAQALTKTARTEPTRITLRTRKVDNGALIEVEDNG